MENKNIEIVNARASQRGEGGIGQVDLAAERYSRFEGYRSLTEDLKLTSADALVMMNMSQQELGSLLDEFKPISKDDKVVS